MRHSLWLGLSCALVCAACGDTSGNGGAGGQGVGGGALANCVDDPFACPAGQTCWISEDQSHFECLNSGQGLVGDTCHNYVGQPTCADGLTCLQLQGTGEGTCQPFCDPMDPDHACPTDSTCTTVTLESTSFHACKPLEGSGGAGGGSSSGGGGAGGG